MFDPEEILDRRTRELAAPVVAGQELRPPSHILVSTGQGRFAIPIGELQGATRQKITPVPLSPPSWLGITHYMESFWPVRWLGVPEGELEEGLTAPYFVLFLRGRKLGLAVERHLGLIALGDEHGREDGPLAQGLEYLRVAWTLSDGTLVLEVQS
ncbi:chemotaxis protein CheW [bacterium]|nr:chemotaxis protein CheW [bacterium]